MTITHAISTERLVNVLQSIALKQQTGCLSVKCLHKQGHTQEEEKGNIFFERGDTVFSLTGQESGETALFRMLNWQHVLYIFTEGVRYTPERQTGGTRAPLAHDILRLSPSKAAEKCHTPPIGIPVIPKTAQRYLVAKMVAESHSAHMGVTSIFRVLPAATNATVLNRLERRERVVLLLLNGKRTVYDVARLIHRDEVDVARTLVRLLKRGYIEHLGAE